MNRTYVLAAYAAAIFLALFGPGCARELLAPETVDGVKPNSIPTGAIALSYDETVVTTTTQWPSTIVRGLNKISDDNKAVLKDYAKTHKTITVDSLGHRFIEVEYTEGDADIRIPKKMYDEIKDKMEPRHPKHNPVKRFTILGNVYTAYGINGAIVFTKTFPPEHPVEGSSSIRTLGAIPVGPSGGRVEHLLSSLQSKGVHYQMLGEKELMYEEQIPLKTGIIRTKTVVDPSSGLVKRLATYNKDGQLASVEEMGYFVIKGYYVLSFRRTYALRNLANGEWGVADITSEYRTNINVESR